MGRRLVIDGNAVYEVDEDCMKEKSQRCGWLQENCGDLPQKCEMVSGICEESGRKPGLDSHTQAV